MKKHNSFVSKTLCLLLLH